MVHMRPTSTRTRGLMIFHTRCLGLAILLSWTFALGAPAQAEWPQWRGPGAVGFSTDERVPTEWNPGSENIRWEAEIPGKGISSPIVKDGKVFVTTAYVGEEGKNLKANAGRIAITASALFLLLTLWAFFRGERKPSADQSSESEEQPTESETPSTRFSFLGLLDGLCVLGATVVSVSFILYVLNVPDEKNLLPESLKLSFGEPTHVWLRSIGILMIGLWAGFGHFARSSFIRLLVAPILLGLAAYLFVSMPPNRWGDIFPLSQRLGVVLPGMMAAVWFVIAFVLSRRANAAPAGRSAPLRALLLLAVVGLFFGLFNFFQPRIGLLRTVICFDEATGKTLWTTPAFLAPAEKIYHSNTFATPTPCTDGTYLLAHFGSGYACLDMQGKVLWHEIIENYPDVSRYGAAASPLMTKDSFIIVQEPELQPSRDYEGAINYITCRDKATGKERWHIEPEDAGNSYATPLLIEHDGKELLLVASWELLVAYDAANGQRLWDLKVPLHQVVPSMVYDDQHVYLAGGTHDAERGILAVKLSNSEGSPEIAWESSRNVPECSSPLLYQGNLYTVTANGVLGCLDAKTGELIWAKRVGGNHYASPVAAAGKIYTLNEDGKTYVVAADTKYKVLSKCNLGEVEFCFASPAISDQNIYIRSLNRLFCIGPNDQGAEKTAQANP